MSLISKAEIQYLEGHKHLSKSYERKMKCIIRMKVEGLKKDILLISKLIPIYQIFDFENLVTIGKENIKQEPVLKSVIHLLLLHALLNSVAHSLRTTL